MTRVAALVLVATVAAAGCAGTPPPQSTYVLNPIAEHTAPATFMNARIAVGPVTLPELVDRPQWVVHQDDHRVQILELHRWAEPLRDGLARVLAVNLGRLLGDSRVQSWRQAAAADADLQLVVDVQRWEARRGEQVAIDVVWTVRGRARGPVSASEFSAIVEPVQGPGHEHLAAAFDRAIFRLAQDIAPRLAALGNNYKGPTR